MDLCIFWVLLKTAKWTHSSSVEIQTQFIDFVLIRHAGHCLRSRDELISDVLLWTPTYGRVKAGRPPRTYIQQLCEDTGCSPEDLPGAMNDRERVRDIRASSTTWWWWWWFFDKNPMVFVRNDHCYIQTLDLGFQNRTLHLCLRINKGQQKWITWIEPEGIMCGTPKSQAVSQSESSQRVNTLARSGDAVLELRTCYVSKFPRKKKQGSEYICPDVVSTITVLRLSVPYTQLLRRFE